MQLVESRVIAGVLRVEPDVHRDPRGRFVRAYQRTWLPQSPPMVQLNRAERVQGCLVGLHYHLLQADCWYVVRGQAAVVLVDLRVGSPTHRAVLHDSLGTGDDHGLYIPPGVGHAIVAVTDITLMYLQDRNYDADDELGLAWDDPDLGIPWPVEAPILSERDRSNPRLADIPRTALPRYEP